MKSHWLAKKFSRHLGDFYKDSGKHLKLRKERKFIRCFHHLTLVDGRLSDTHAFYSNSHSYICIYVTKLTIAHGILKEKKKKKILCTNRYPIFHSIFQLDCGTRTYADTHTHTQTLSSVSAIMDKVFRVSWSVRHGDRRCCYHCTQPISLSKGV